MPFMATIWAKRPKGWNLIQMEKFLSKKLTLMVLFAYGGFMPLHGRTGFASVDITGERRKSKE